MLRCDLLERADMAVTKLQISPLIVNRFKNGFHQWIQHIFLVLVEHKKFFFRKIFSCFQNLDALFRLVAGKPFVLEDFVLNVGTSVASALTVETIVEIVKCIADVDMLPRGRMGSKCEIFMFVKSGYAHDRNISIFRRRASTVTGNTLIGPSYASVRQSMDSLHRNRHKVKKKSRRCRALKPLELRSRKNSRRRGLWHTTMPVSLA